MLNFLYYSMAGRLTIAEKNRIVEEIISALYTNESLSAKREELRQRYGVSERTLYSWFKLAEPGMEKYCLLSS